MWKQKLKICGINLTAYSVVFVIMILFAPDYTGRKILCCSSAVQN